MENCEIIKGVQTQLNDPGIVEVVVPPGTYEVYQTIVVPAGKRIVSEAGLEKTILNGHTSPVIICEAPVRDYPVEGFTINASYEDETE